jgi:hypothetical protein
MEKPYYFIRYEWFNRVDLDALAKELAEDFVVELRPMPSGPVDVSIYKFEREGLKVSADTLAVFLHPFKAVLFQRESAPFTSRDLDLRDRILTLYRKNKSSLLATSVYHEPKFQIAEEPSARSDSD